MDKFTTINPCPLCKGTPREMRPGTFVCVKCGVGVLQLAGSEKTFKNCAHGYLESKIGAEECDVLAGRVDSNRICPCKAHEPKEEEKGD
jgi:hypothetical protein